MIEEETLGILKPSVVSNVDTYCIGSLDDGGSELDFSLVYSLKINLRSKIGPKIRYFHPVSGKWYVFKLVEEEHDDWGYTSHYVCDDHSLFIYVKLPAGAQPVYDSGIAKGLRQSIYSWLNLYSINPNINDEELHL